MSPIRDAPVTEARHGIRQLCATLRASVTFTTQEWAALSREIDAAASLLRRGFAILTDYRFASRDSEALGYPIDVLVVDALIDTDAPERRLERLLELLDSGDPFAWLLRRSDGDADEYKRVLAILQYAREDARAAIGIGARGVSRDRMVELKSDLSDKMADLRGLGGWS